MVLMALLMGCSPTPASVQLLTPTLAETRTVRQAAIATRDALATLSVTSQPPTQTPDIQASIVAEITQLHLEDLTGTASSMPSATPTPIHTPTPADTATSAPIDFDVSPISNAAWTPIERQFAGVPMVLLPKGCFLMGTADGSNNEQPAHQVCFDSAVWVDKYEVWQDQYNRFGGQKSIAHDPQDDFSPVSQITWTEANAYCALRSGRLLTEAEWEYAARGPDGASYPWGEEFRPDALGISVNPLPVGTFSAGVSWVGAFEWVGNVSEWTNSAYVPYPYQAQDGRESGEVKPDTLMILRGGLPPYNALNTRATARFYTQAGHVLKSVGLRCLIETATPATLLARAGTTLALSPISLTPVADSLPFIVTEAYGGINLRAEASTRSNVLRVLVTGAQGFVTGRSAAWYKIQLADGLPGWISMSVSSQLLIDGDVMSLLYYDVEVRVAPTTVRTATPLPPPTSSGGGSQPPTNAPQITNTFVPQPPTAVPPTGVPPTVRPPTQVPTSYSTITDVPPPPPTDVPPPSPTDVPTEVPPPPPTAEPPTPPPWATATPVF